MQSGSRWFRFALTALALSAQPPRRVAFLGTSITCGAGATQRFLPIVKAGIEQRFRTKIETYDLCFGGAHSFTTLLLLKHTALPWKPDLVIVETGALDGFAPELSRPAIEQIFHELATARIAAVFLARTAKCSEENSRHTILDLAKTYNYPIADGNTAYLPDGCHPSNEGHALIAANILKAIDTNVKPHPPSVPAPFKDATFRAASQARIAGPGNQAPLTFFKESGAALKGPPGQAEWRFLFQGTLAAILFRLGNTPQSIQFQIDKQPWKKVHVQPDWFLNYYLETNLAPGDHELGLRVQSHTGVIIDGLQTATP